jgi:uncharacterized repeat protein (TIGR01451 family)
LNQIQRDVGQQINGMEADECFEGPDLLDPPIKLGARCDMPILPKPSLPLQQIHDGNKNMSESETTPEIGPRFTKATIIRISAVAFFVTLGSVAVIQSMKYVSSDSNEDPSQLVSDIESPSLGDESLNDETTPSQPPSAFKEPLNSAASKNTFKPPTLGKPSSSGLVKSTSPPNQSFKPIAFPPKTDSSTFDTRQKNPQAATKKSPANSGINDFPLVKAAPAAIRPDRFASNGAPLPFSNPSSSSKLPEDPITPPASLNFPPKQTDQKKPDPFRVNAPPKQGSDISGIKTSPPASANNSATRLLDQVTDGKPSTRPTPQPLTGGFAQPATQPFAKPVALPSQSNLTNSQPPQATTDDPASTNIESFNNRARPPKNLVAFPNSNLANPAPIKPGMVLNPKSNSLGASVPGAFASQSTGKTPATITPPIGSPKGQLGTPPGLTPPTTSINPQTPKSFTPNRTQPFNNSKSKRSAITSLASTSNPSVATPATRLTRDTPGDRQLEGIQAPSLTVEKLSPIEIQLNQQASFEIIVRNIGRVTAEEVQVVDQVPAGCEFVGATPQAQPQGKLQSLSWNLGTLRPGQEKKITFQLKPTQPGEMGSVAQVTFATQASMRTLVTKPVLEIVHQTEQTHLIGDSVILDVIVINKGDGPAKNVLIQQKVPEQLEFPDGLPNASRGIEYEVGTLMPGKSQRVKLALKAANIGKIKSIMYASAEGGLRAQHELPIEVIAPKLVTQSSGPKKRFLKRSATHEFRVANQGTANATNVQLIAKLPNGLRFVQANNQGRYDSETHAVYWSLAELAQNIEAKVELKTMPVDVGNQPITFESSADLNIKSALEHDLSVEHLVDVFFEIDDVIDPIEIGGDTSYRVRLVNQGTKAATNIRLQIDFPAGLAPTSVNGSLRHTIRGQQIIFEPINSMNPNDELSFMINGRGQTVGDHRVVVSMQTDGRTSPVSKQESTRVYSDQ